MSILIGIGIVTTVTTFYLGRKGWQAFHKAVGISPGVLTYQDYDAPLSLATLSLQQLTLNKQHLKKQKKVKKIDAGKSIDDVNEQVNKCFASTSK